MVALRVFVGFYLLPLVALFGCKSSPSVDSQVYVCHTVIEVYGSEVLIFFL